MSETEWKSVDNLGFQDIKYEKTDDGIAKITINRPEVRNAFRPRTVKELSIAFTDARDDGDIGVVILTGQGNEAVSYTHLDVYKRQVLDRDRPRWRWRLHKSCASANTLCWMNGSRPSLRWDRQG